MRILDVADVRVSAVISELRAGAPGARDAWEALFGVAEELLDPFTVSYGLRCEVRSSPARWWLAHVFGITHAAQPDAVVDSMVTTSRSFQGIVGAVRWEIGEIGDPRAGSELPDVALVAEDEPVNLLNLNDRVSTALARRQVRTTGQLLDWSPSALLELPYVGKRSVTDVEDRLFDAGYRFGRYEDPTAPPRRR